MAAVIWKYPCGPPPSFARVTGFPARYKYPIFPPFRRLSSTILCKPADTEGQENVYEVFVS
eukprot:396476-Amorphochlora_amoeboformis.AAC.3